MHVNDRRLNCEGENLSHPASRIDELRELNQDNASGVKANLIRPVPTL
jgi:hypothetical protein